MSQAAPQRIAVVQTAFLGDVVFTSPLVAALTRAWPGCEVIFVATPRASPIAACIPGVSRVVPFDKRKDDRGLAGIARVARALGRPDLVLVPHPSPRSTLLAKLSGAPRRVGYASWHGRLFCTDTVPERKKEPFVQRMLDLLAPLGLTGSTRLQLAPPPAEFEAAASILGAGRHVGLVIGSEWETKRWPVEHWASLADRLHARGVRAVLLGAPNERELAGQILARIRSAAPLDLVGNSVLESLGILGRLSAVVGGDSGLLHASRAMGIPTVLLFGPTDPGVHFMEAHARALRLGLECQPCHAHGPRVCPLGHHDCMRKLDVDRVDAVLRGLCPELAA